ncbi:metal ABC transporter solute-binding protein, Zn/Mn family [Rubellimicrobium roseum]|uniref:Manganese transporter n=1 Tax=Rubellimicrobium roseum TaxID=687525 RepID=A0A5C4NA70_9RHOB|nr:zinc ABC transporter substrate-binding protein [Rubellimicrobium roseum]TNC69155.1 manganese transporter [Rubellimicrobium roseum]
MPPTPLCRRSVILGLAAAPWLTGAARAAGPLRVVATMSMIADTARALGGEGVAVQGLMGPGVDPHAYRQTRSDIAAMVNADLTLWHGLFLEAQMEDFLHDLAAHKPVAAVAESLPRDRLLGHDRYADRFDPHVWMDPALWSGVSDAIGGALLSVAPDLPVEAALGPYQAELASLRAYADEVLGSVPPESRVLVTAHDAFAYFGRAWGFDVQGIQGVSTESEAGVARIEELVSLLVERQVRAVFVESSVSDRGLRALIEGTAARGHTVRIGGVLFSDAMGEEGTYEGTYLGMIDHNVTLVARELGGTTPEGGRLGRLWRPA